jgi:chromosome partitioning protein
MSLDETPVYGANAKNCAVAALGNTDMAAKVIAFINYKGGVAKTTTTYHVGCSLAQHLGKRVLFVDIDPQTNLTFLCASIGEWEQFKKNTGTIATMYQRFQDKKPLDTKRFVWC